jgi:hypothetical protein
MPVTLGASYLSEPARVKIMASLFNKDSEDKAPLDAYSRERIEREIRHLSEKKSVRDGSKNGPSHRGAWWLTLLVLVLLALFFMDPALHAYHRGEAIRAYSYLHHFGSEKKARELLGTGIFTPNEVDLLNSRQGAFQNYYSGPMEGAAAADSVIHYLDGVANLQRSDYAKLGWLNKLRFQLFFHFGMTTPTDWPILDPTITG